MFPLRSTERVVNATPMTILLIAVNVVVFIYQNLLTPPAHDEFLLRYALIPDRLHYSALVTSMFLHGGWMHIIGNMLFLWVFGRNLEDVMGSGRFFAFYMMCGILAGITHILLNAYSPLPTIGASGAIAGVMGAYLVKFPGAKIVTLFFIVFFVTTVELPAAFVLLYWFVLQIFSGVGSISTTSYAGGGTAWFAHIGGFIAGMLLIRRFQTRRRFAYHNWE